MKKVALATALLLLGWWTAWCQSFDADHLMLLVIGSSASRPDVHQKALLQRVQRLRNDPAWSELKVGTMHFDRPREARFAQQVLGVHRSMLPAVALVQLDEQGRNPIRSLQVWSGLRQERLSQIEAIAEEWSRAAGNPLPLFTPIAEALSTPGPGLSIAQPVSPPTAPPTPPPPVSPPAARPRDRVWAGVSLPTGSVLRSGDGRFELCFQSDGDLVIYRNQPAPRQRWWSTRTQGSGAQVLRLGTDGVVRLLSGSGQVVWSGGRSDTFSNGYLHMQNDGNLVAYRIDGNGASFSWSSSTMENPPPPQD